jgi:hypothetical protein
VSFAFSAFRCSVFDLFFFGVCLAYRHLTPEFVAGTDAQNALHEAHVVYVTAFLLSTPARFRAAMQMSAATAPRNGPVEAKTGRNINEKKAVFALNLSSASLLGSNGVATDVSRR